MQLGLVIVPESFKVEVDTINGIFKRKVYVTWSLKFCKANISLTLNMQFQIVLRYANSRISFRGKGMQIVLEILSAIARVGGYCDLLDSVAFVQIAPDVSILSWDSALQINA